MPVGRALARVLAGAAGIQVGLRLAGSRTGWIGPVRVAAGVRLARKGGTVVEVPPLGRAELRTHRGPLQLRALAVDVDPARAPEMLDPGTPDGLTAVGAGAARDARTLAVALAGRAGLAGIGGAVVVAALGLRRPADVAGAAAAGAGLLGLATAAGAVTADRDAWRTPQLSGLLTKAPLVLGDLRTAPDRIATYRDQLADLLRTGTGVYRRVAALPDPPPADAIRLLHVSDIHLSPLAFPLAKALVDEYRVAAVIDTGDLVDWGSPPEDGFAAQIAGLGVPYVFVKGNHDSTGTAAAVARQPNAVVLDATDGPREVAGLRIAGFGDPRFTPDKTTGDDTAAHRVVEAAAAFAPTLAGQDVDVLVVHDPAAVRALAGTAPLLLAGHTHKRSSRRRRGTLVLVQGSSGGSGLRGVQQDPPTPVSMSVLHLDRATHRLHSVDEVTLGGLGAVSVHVVRRPAADLG